MALRYYRAVAWQVFGVRIPSDWDAIAVRIWVRQARRAGDVDNLIKPVLDALTRAGVWVDDKIVASVHCERLDPKDGAPCTYIELTRARGGLYVSGAPW